MELTDYIRCKGRGHGAHDLELAAMSDPFAADALEGLQDVDGDHLSVVARLRQRIERSARSRHPNLRLRVVCGTAAALLFGAAGILFLRLPSRPVASVETVSERPCGASVQKQSPHLRLEKEKSKALTPATRTSSRSVTDTPRTRSIAIEPVLIVGFNKYSKWEFVGGTTQNQAQKSPKEPIGQQPGAPPAPLHSAGTERPTESQLSATPQEEAAFPSDPIFASDETEYAAVPGFDRPENDPFSSGPIPDDLPDDRYGGG